MNKKNGNPVPSLENLSLQKYPELTDCWGNDCNELNRKIFIENINFYLQNGVETNKRQPNKNCDCANQSKIGCHSECVY